MPKILIISTNVHKALAVKQLDLCTALVKNAGYEYQVEMLEAGVYEIPFTINIYQQNKPFDAYLALGLLLKENVEHYETLMAHLRYCFTQFALNQIIVGNGVISGENMDELHDKIHHSNPCISGYPSAFHAANCLLQLKNRISG